MRKIGHNKCVCLPWLYISGSLIFPRQIDFGRLAVSFAPRMQEGAKRRGPRGDQEGGGRYFRCEVSYQSAALLRLPQWHRQVSFHLIVTRKWFALIFDLSPQLSVIFWPELCWHIFLMCIQTIPKPDFSPQVSLVSTEAIFASEEEFSRACPRGYTTASTGQLSFGVPPALPGAIVKCWRH